MRARVVFALAVATFGFAACAATAGASPGNDKMLYGCAYVTNLGDSSNVNVLVWDKMAPHAHGWIKFVGSGLNSTEPFVLDGHGWHTEPFHVTSFGKEHITVSLSKPKLSYTFDFTLNAASDVTTKGCKPH